MAVDSIASTAAASQASRAGASLSGNFDTFLKLLTAQLQNQDPLEPMDTAQFTQQLVQYSGVEQAIYTNQNLEKLIAGQNAGASGNAVSYLGREIAAQGDEARLQEGEAQWTYLLEKTAATATVNVVDTNGRVVFSMAGDPDAGSHDFVWDGRDSEGDVMPDGVYRLTVTAKDAAGANIPVATAIRGIVTEIDLSQAEPVLYVRGIGVKLSDVSMVATAAPDA